jgi:tetratricopeptide (TPR) repeat protein
MNITFRIRKGQNYDWAEDYLKKGLDMMSHNNLEKAIEYLRDAEKLDPLNKDIFLNKGICYMQLVSHILL